jgi:DNA-binding NarL/FixJ family response regulator
MIRLLFADDHEVVRAGLSALLANYPDIEVVGAASNGTEAVALAAELRPDVVIMDLAMPGMGGIEATRQILREQPQTHVLAFTSFSDRDAILGALDAGAVGFLMKDTEPEELLKGIRGAARGESPLASRAAHILMENRRCERIENELTERERQVLALVAKGLSNKEIGVRLGIAERTVKTHLTNVFQRIGVTSRTQAALWGQLHGFVQDGRPELNDPRANAPLRGV